MRQAVLCSLQLSSGPVKLERPRCLKSGPTYPVMGYRLGQTSKSLQTSSLQSNSADVTTKLSPTSKIMPHPLSDSNDAAALSVKCKSVNSISYSRYVNSFARNSRDTSEEPLRQVAWHLFMRVSDPLTLTKMHFNYYHVPTISMGQTTPSQPYHYQTLRRPLEPPQVQQFYLSDSRSLQPHRTRPVS